MSLAWYFFPPISFLMYFHSSQLVVPCLLSTRNWFHDSVIHRAVSIPFYILSPYRLLKHIELFCVVIQLYVGFPGGSLLNTLPALWEIRVRFLGQENPLEEGMATHSSLLAWRIPWTEEPCGLQSMGSQRLRHDWATNTSLHTHFHSFLDVWFTYTYTYILLF